MAAPHDYLTWKKQVRILPSSFIIKTRSRSNGKARQEYTQILQRLTPRKDWDYISVVVVGVNSFLALGLV